MITPTVTVSVIILRLLGGLQLLEWATFDQLFRYRPPEQIDRRIVIVTIEESDIQEGGEWPLSDEILAIVLEKIKAQNPRAIGLDIYRYLRRDPGHERLMAVFASTPNLIGSQKVVGDSQGDSVPPPPVLSELDQVGAVDILVDEDGKIRRAMLSAFLENGKLIYSLPVRLALIYLQAEGIYLEMLDASQGKVRLGEGNFLPLKSNDGGYVNVDTGGYQILFNFRTHGCRRWQEDCQLFETVSLMDVLTDQVPDNFATDRIVFIGSTAASLKDRFFTPFTHSYATAPTGVEIHADLTSLLLSAALEGRPLLKVWSEPLEWGWIFLGSGTGTILGWVFLRMRWKAISLLLTSGCVSMFAYLSFLQGWWVPLVPGLVSLWGGGVLITIYLVFVEREDRQTVMNLFERHVTAKIAQAVWRERYQLLKEGKLLGRQMTATVLFTDIQGFTQISETTAPDVLMEWLNQYMNTMVDVILKHDGVVDKFMGDAVMAVFGVPFPSTTPEAIAQDARDAVSCAVEMGKQLQGLNQRWQSQGLPTVRMRVGIATGTVVAGSLGSQQRLNYTTIGDTVNVASRLESYDKKLGADQICRILMSEETQKYVAGEFQTELICSEPLRGRQGMIGIYRVINELGDEMNL